DAGFQVGQDALQLLFAELLQALLQLFASLRQLVDRLVDVFAGGRPLVLVEVAGGILFIRNGAAHLIGPGRLRPLRRRVAWRRAAGRTGLRAAARRAIARRALALVACLLIARRRLGSRALLVALVVFLVPRFRGFLSGLVAHRRLHRVTA